MDTQKKKRKYKQIDWKRVAPICGASLVFLIIIAFVAYLSSQGILGLFWEIYNENLNILLAYPFIGVLVARLLYPYLEKTTANTEWEIKLFRRIMKFKLLPVIMGVIIVIILAVPAVRAYNDPDFELEWGMVLEGGKKYREAIPHYTQIIDKTSEQSYRWLALLKRSNCHLRLCQYDDVIADCMIILDDKNVQSNIKRFINYRVIMEATQTRIDIDYFDIDARMIQSDAIKYTDELRAEAKVSIDEIVPLAYMNRASAYASTGEIPLAIDDYSRIVEIIPDDYNTYVNRGVLYGKLDLTDEAIADFNKVIMMEPKYSNDYITRGRAYFQLAEWEKAIENFDNGIKLDPTNASYYSRRGYCYSEIKLWDKALDDYSEAINLDPMEPIYYIYRTEYYFRLEEWGDMLNDMNSAIKLVPANSMFYYLRGYCYSAQENWGKALADYNKAINLDSTIAIFYSYRGFCYNRLEKWKKAIEDYSRAIELDKTDVGLYYRRAYCYYRLEKWEEAIEDYSRAIETDIKEVSLYLSRAYCFRRLERWEEAAEDLNRVVELDPINASYYRHHANGYVPINPVIDIHLAPPSPFPILLPFMSGHHAYIIGYPEGDVRPGNSITRAEVATVFFRLLTDEARAANWTQVNPFPDVNINDWFNNAISVMCGMGIVNGYPDGTFKPNSPITRGELAKIAAEFAEIMVSTGSGGASFSDVAGHWSEENIKKAASIGWVNGYPDGTFRPDQYITRAEFMTLVNRMLERVPELQEDLLIEDMVKWVDNANPDTCYYLAVQEATNSHMYRRKEGKFVPGLGFEYEYWAVMMEVRDWAALEKSWSTAYS